MGNKQIFLLLIKKYLLFKKDILIFKSGSFIFYNFFKNIRYTVFKGLGGFALCNFFLNKNFDFFSFSFYQKKLSSFVRKNFYLLIIFNSSAIIKINFLFMVYCQKKKNNFLNLLILNTFIIKLICFTLLSIKSFIFFKIKHIYIGLNESIEITGYARKAWILKSTNFVNFKVGKSFVNSVLLPKLVKLRLFKKRFLFCFSFDFFTLNFFLGNIWMLRPADNYKGGGIRLKSKNLILKERFVKK